MSAEGPLLSRLGPRGLGTCHRALAVCGEQRLGEKRGSLGGSERPSRTLVAGPQRTLGTSGELLLRPGPPGAWGSHATSAERGSRAPAKSPVGTPDSEAPGLLRAQARLPRFPLRWRRVVLSSRPAECWRGRTDVTRALWGQGGAQRAAAGVPGVHQPGAAGPASQVGDPSPLSPLLPLQSPLTRSCGRERGFD